MGIIASRFAMSLDGFVADPKNDVGPLFDWFFNGDVEIKPKGYPVTFRMSEASAGTWNEMMDDAGAFVCGRKVFDYTGGWGGRPPGGNPTFVVTSRPAPEDWPPIPDAPFTFVHDGLESALEQARAAAGGGDIGLSGPSMARQCLRLGVLDEIWIDLVPVFFGEGVPYFEDLGDLGVELETVSVVQGKGVTHLRYRVTYS